jgi:carbonic anhydrase
MPPARRFAILNCMYAWLTVSNQAQSVVDDVTRIRAHPLVPAGIAIYGYIDDVATGRLVEVPEATAVGRVTNLADLGAAQP